MKKSATPVDHGFANPQLGKAKFLLNNMDAYKQLIGRVQSVAHRGNKMSFAQLRAACDANGVKEQLRQLFEQSRKIQDTPPVLGVPPPPRELYGRFGKGMEIVDVGTRDGRKIKNFTGVLKITCVDPELDIPEHTVFRSVKTTIEDLLPTLTDNVFFSSFMAFCQLEQSTQEKLLDFDGMHLVPDHSVLLANGAASYNGSKISVRTPICDYEDHPLIVPGVPVDTGYRMVVTLKAENINISFTGDPVETDYNPVIDARPASFEEMNLEDVTQKMDGEPWEFENDNGSVYVVNRKGLQYVGTTDFKQHFALHAEKLQNCYTLIRVVAYKGMALPHCGDLLRLFTSRVRIKINGLPLCAPPKWTSEIHNVRWVDDTGEVIFFREKIDGIISRYNGRDTYCKFTWTADLRDTDRDTLELKLKDRGITLNAIMLPGLWEYGLERQGHELRLLPIRERFDKRSVTKFDTLMFMLTRPTLTEQAVLENLVTESSN